MNCARWDLCGGCRVTGIPTAILGRHATVGRDDHEAPFSTEEPFMDAVATTAGRVTPWNKGKLLGQDARGLREDEVIEGVRRDTLSHLADWTAEAAKVLVF